MVDHLNRILAWGGGFQHKFFKNSNAQGVARGEWMLKVRFDWYIIVYLTVTSNVKEIILAKLTYLSMIKETKKTYPAYISTGNGQFLIKRVPFTALYYRVFVFFLHYFFNLGEVIWTQAFYHFRVLPL